MFAPAWPNGQPALLGWRLKNAFVSMPLTNFGTLPNDFTRRHLAGICLESANSCQS